MTEPRTRAGRLLLDRNTSRDTATNEWLLNDILAIEREAEEAGVLRQLERHIHEEQNPGRVVSLGPATLDADPDCHEWGCLRAVQRAAPPSKKVGAP